MVTDKAVTAYDLLLLNEASVAVIVVVVDVAVA